MQTAFDYKKNSPPNSEIPWQFPAITVRTEVPDIPGFSRKWKPCLPSPYSNQWTTQSISTMHRGDRLLHNATEECDRLRSNMRDRRVPRRTFKAQSGSVCVPSTQPTGKPSVSVFCIDIRSAHDNVTSTVLNAGDISVSCDVETMTTTTWGPTESHHPPSAAAAELMMMMMMSDY